METASQSLVAEALAAVLDEEGGVAPDRSVTLASISGQVHDSRGMQRHEASLVEFGFADAEATGLQIQDDIDEIQSEGLAGPQTCAGN